MFGKYSGHIIATATFLVLCIIFIQILPLIPYDGDDWRYLAQYRVPLPTLSEWNPARILPEITMPIFGYIGAYIVYPITGEYIYAFTILSAIIKSAAIATLAYCIYRLLVEVTSNNEISALAVLFFLAISMTLLKTKPSNNVFLFYEQSVTLLFYYTLPNILNSILVIHLSTLYIRHGVRNAQDWPKFNVYFALYIFYVQFSMTTAAAISCIFASMLLIVYMIKSKTRARELEKALLFIVVCWVSAAVFDIFGARFSQTAGTTFSLQTSIAAFTDLGREARRSFKYLIPAIIALGAVASVYFYKKSREKEDSRTGILIGIFCVSCALHLTLCLLIDAKAGGYNRTISFTYGTFFFALTATTLALAYLATKFTPVKYILPFIVLVLLMESTNSGRHWRQPQGTPQDRATVNRWLDDIRTAEAKGQNSATITVPKMAWPHPQEWFGQVLSHTLFTHGVTQKKIQIHLQIPSEE